MNDFAYLPGFGNQHSTEAVAGALPVGRNSPQRPPLGLYAELFSATAFTAPRDRNLRSWLYRRRPSAVQGRFEPYEQALWKTGRAGGAGGPPEPMRWPPIEIPVEPVDFVDGLRTIAASGSPDEQTGVAVHVALFNTPMKGRAIVDADGELLLVPQSGTLRLRTELGRLVVAPGEIAIVPRGIAFAVDVDGPTRAYVGENYGAPFRLPELGPIGSNGLANPRDFLAPAAWFEPELAPCELIRKDGGAFWRRHQGHSPFDVVAWHGNLAPYKYDTRRFMAVGSVSFDHPDPSIFTVLTSPSDTPGTANCDFVIFPPRWMVAEGTFRPPWFHRNVMSELMGLVYGRYDAKPEGFAPGAISLHNSMVPHGPDAEAHERASGAELRPEKLDGTLAFMFESRWRFHPTDYALRQAPRDPDYLRCWDGLPDRFAAAR